MAPTVVTPVTDYTDYTLNPLALSLNTVTYVLNEKLTSNSLTIK